MIKKVLFIALAILIFLPVFSVRAAVADEPIKVLIVPGHDSDVWGAQYGNLKEASMNLSLGTQIFNILKKDKRFKVYITRDSNGYTKEFADYFSEHQADIISFRDNAKKEREEDINGGDFIEREGVPHNDASDKVSVILYGINKWANENKMDAVIHVHFNDYPRSKSWTAGVYKGFAIYMPEEQMSNFKESTKLAKSIFSQLKSRYITSDYPPEKGGLIPDQSLIALGSNGSLESTVRSILIEYGYIYRFWNNTTRPKSYTNMASLTAKGITKYFFK